MVKHQKEKLYFSTREYRQNHNNNNNTTTSQNHRRLPFHCCALSLNAFTSEPIAVIVPSKISPNDVLFGVLFDKFAFIEHLLQHGTNPISGEKLSMSDDHVIDHLIMDKNAETGDWQCPVLCKKFTDYSKIVAISSRLEKGKKVAYVLSYEAVQELNFKTNHMEHLITGEKFSKKDIIWLQDPDNAELCKLRDISGFQHIQDMRVQERKAQKNDIRHSVTSSRVMNKVSSLKADETKKRSKDNASNDWVSEGKRLKIFNDSEGSSSVIDGTKTNIGLTSTVMSKSDDIRVPTENEKLQKRFDAMKKLKKKGYVQLQTNLGNIMLELDCDIAPRTCTNFLGLVSDGKYDGVMFHRNIKKFMIQCGSKKKDSYFGGAFKDEFDDRLSHVERGVLAMANAGSHTNRDQFYITFGSASHLDRKHSVFGRVIDGFDVLDTMESIPTDKTDRPIHDIKILNAEIAIDPSEEAVEAEQNREQAKEDELKSAKTARIASALGTNAANDGNNVSNLSENKSTETLGGISSSIGRYLPNTAFGKLDGKSTNATQAITKPQSESKQSKAKSKFGDFSSW